MAKVSGSGAGSRISNVKVKPVSTGAGIKAGITIEKQWWQKIKDAVNPVNPDKTGWMKQQVYKRTTVTPLPKKKK